MQFFQYSIIDGIPTIPDSHLTGVYQRMVQDRVLHKIFYTGSIRSVNEFLNHCKNPITQHFIIMDDTTLYGYSFLDNINNSVADVHYCGFKSSWGKSKSVTLGRFGVKSIFNLEYSNGHKVYQTLIGKTAKSNKLAVNLHKKIGMKEVGVVPFGTFNYYEQQTDDLIITYITREDCDGWGRK